MYTGLHHLHSSLRYAILVVLILAIAKSWKGWKKNLPYEKQDNLLAILSVILVHTQFIVGTVLYYISPKVNFTDMAATMKEPLFRFFTVEHITMMLTAVVLITIGRSLSKRATEDVVKHKKIAIFFLIGFLLIFIAIPWPFLRSFGSWF